MKPNDRRSSLDTIHANLDAVQMSSADREAARHQLRVADSVATVIARGIVLIAGLASSARQRARHFASPGIARRREPGAAR